MLATEQNIYAVPSNLAQFLLVFPIKIKHLQVFHIVQAHSSANYASSDRRVPWFNNSLLRKQRSVARNLGAKYIQRRRET